MSEGISPLTIVLFLAIVALQAWPVIVIYIIWKLFIPKVVRSLFVNLAIISLIVITIQTLSV